MKIINSPEEVKGLITGSCLTIGNFDGVHLAHQKLIRRVVEKAAKKNLQSLVMTFDPHPLRVLVGPNTPPAITSTASKLEFIEELKPDFLFVMKFTRELAGMPPEQFVSNILVDGLALKDMVIGYDYSFGKGRKGNYELLSSLGQDIGFSVERMEPLLIDGAIVSSTRIRDLVKAGHVWEARNLLGRFYRVTGEVVRGKDRGGKLLGFPTANLHLTDKLCPKSGVYAVWAVVNGDALPGVANIGYNPTFGNDVLSVEVHILDFKRDLYGKTIRVHFIQRLRSEKKFNSIAELKQQIGDDVDIGRKILSAPEAML